MRGGPSASSKDFLKIIWLGGWKKRLSLHVVQKCIVQYSKDTFGIISQLSLAYSVSGDNFYSYSIYLEHIHRLKSLDSRDSRLKGSGQAEVA